MEIVTSNCPDCGAELEFPLSFQNVICRNCGAAYKASHNKSAVVLRRIDGDTDSEDAELAAELDDAIGEMEEQIEEVREEIEATRSREQGAALQLGCAVFGVIGAVIMVLAFFVTVGHGYFGGWLFYAALAAAVVIGGFRIRSKLLTQEQREKLVQQRLGLEEALARLETDRDRLTRLKESYRQSA